MLQIVQLYNVFTPETTPNEFKTLYVEKLFFVYRYLYFMLLYRYFVFNFGGCNLDETIKHHTPFPEEYVKKIIYGILRGLKVQIDCSQYHIYLIKSSSYIL